jgi:hypothetical protein
MTSPSLFIPVNFVTMYLRVYNQTIYSKKIYYKNSVL